MKKYGRLGSLIWVVLGVGLCIGSIRLKLGGIHNPGPGFLPFLTGMLLGIFGLILAFSGSSKDPREDEVEIKDTLSMKNLKKNLKPLSTLLILFAYILLIEPLGFLLASFLFLFSLFKLSEPRKWLKPLVISLCAVILSYLIIYVWLRCQFPRGIFGL